MDLKPANTILLLLTIRLDCKLISMPCVILKKRCMLFQNVVKLCTSKVFTYFAKSQFTYKNSDIMSGVIYDYFTFK